MFPHKSREAAVLAAGGRSLQSAPRPRRGPGLGFVPPWQSWEKTTRYFRGGGCWIEIKTECLLSDARLEERLEYSRNVCDWASVMSENGPSTSSNVAPAGNRSGWTCIRYLGRLTRILWAPALDPRPLVTLGPLTPKGPTTQDIRGTENQQRATGTQALRWEANERALPSPLCLDVPTGPSCAPRHGRHRAFKFNEIALSLF